MEYGYARVSTKEQNEERQLIALRAAGLHNHQIFLDKQSGKDFNRCQYQRLLRRLKRGDTLIIKSIDRLGRNYHEILEQWRIITAEKQAAIVVLDMPLLDTHQNRDLTGTSAAKARGVQFGRPRKERPENFDELKSLWVSGRLSARVAATQMGVSHQTFLSWVREHS